ncbi:glycosyltransferase family A protein [Flavobacterium sp. AED]|uniref:glycosyltransferase family 2 protein n=1 Tax=Flavobacterium sp. AED TaxID=1423323 RepID=UPI00068962D3|nr:glycosyltransferase family A protein [Flavobacterium sp. AED]
MYPLVTVMIATYNQSKYILQAVESALNQDYSNIEIIVSDDSLNDDTKIVLEKYVNFKNFAYYKNDKNIGRIKNYRKLLYDLSNGKYVIMLDGDDFFIDNRHISKAVSFFNKDEKIVVVGAGINFFYEKDNFNKELKITEANHIFEGKDIFKVPQFLANHQTSIYNRKLACELDFYRHPSMGSDSESLFRLYLRGRVVYLPSISSTWRIHEENTTFIRDIKLQIKELDFIDSIAFDAMAFLNPIIINKWKKFMYQAMANHIYSIVLKSKDIKLLIFIQIKLFEYISVKKNAKQILRILKEKLNDSSITECIHGKRS